MAVIGGLCHSSISRLKDTANLLSSDTTKVSNMVAAKGHYNVKINYLTTSHISITLHTTVWTRWPRQPHYITQCWINQRGRRAQKAPTQYFCQRLALTLFAVPTQNYTQSIWMHVFCIQVCTRVHDCIWRAIQISILSPTKGSWHHGSRIMCMSTWC